MKEEETIIHVMTVASSIWTHKDESYGPDPRPNIELSEKNTRPISSLKSKEQCSLCNMFELLGTV